MTTAAPSPAVPDNHTITELRARIKQLTRELAEGVIAYKRLRDDCELAEERNEYLKNALDRLAERNVHLVKENTGLKHDVSRARLGLCTRCLETWRFKLPLVASAPAREPEAPAPCCQALVPAGHFPVLTPAGALYGAIVAQAANRRRVGYVMPPPDFDGMMTDDPLVAPF